ncbi:unnamed protein product [Microthlaspi erraticum]|uniref:Uncharacterized protein n=1 Tax=Microthlaspi erraticum TaxID=1685480 RepID=A0A6D2LBX1_9BRAS|nr:unnamed protein product [Microthlaspi erraticum]
MTAASVLQDASSQPGSAFEEYAGEYVCFFHSWMLSIYPVWSHRSSRFGEKGQALQFNWLYEKVVSTRTLHSRLISLSLT